MHTSAMANGKAFFETYGPSLSGPDVVVVDVGAQDVNGSLREVCPPRFRYVGVDFIAGKGVDVVLDDPYVLPFETGSVDIAVSSSCLEHSELFWLSYLEMMRILKPGGLCYLNVPSNGDFHRFPVDCWRFYPDSGGALATWARRNGMNALLLESYTSEQLNDAFNDFVAVFLRDADQIGRHPRRMIDTIGEFSNGLRHPDPTVLKPQRYTEDQRRLRAVGQIAAGRIKVR